MFAEFNFPLKAVVLLASAVSLLAQDSAPSLKSQFLANYDDTSKKIVSLAEAVPAEKYSWRPADGVRSIGEVYVHLIGANFNIPNALGVKPPADVKLSRDMEKTLTDKEQIIPLLKKAMDHAREAVSNAMDDPDTATKLFGRPFTNAGASLTLITHMHEHLGQSIAYARSNGVTPPWSKKSSD